MFLGFISKLDQFFTDFFSRLGEEFTLGTLGVLFTGIIIGIVGFGAIYGILMVISLRSDKEYKTDLNHVINPDNEKINQEVDAIKERFVNYTEGLGMKEKFQVLGSSIMETINTVAGEYYPNSKYPLYELTVEELLMLLRYISNKIEMIFNKPFLRPFKRMSISQIFKMLDAKKKIDENKIVKAANKAKIGKLSKIFFTVINYANPVYWLKKLVTGTTVNFAIRKISLIIIDMVAVETNNTYSKVIFEEERKQYNSQIDETLKLLEEGTLNDE